MPELHRPHNRTTGRALVSFPHRPRRPALVENDHLSPECSSDGDGMLSRWRPPRPLFALPPRVADAAITSVGNTSRLIALRRKLEAGCALHVAALGGSSTAGHAMARDSPQLYHALLHAWLSNRTGDRHSNSGTPASGPQYMEKCLQLQLAEPVDLVLVEFAQNMEHGEEDGLALERLLRRLLLLRSKPAVVVVNLPKWGRRGTRADEEHRRVNPLVAHYGLPAVSLSALLDAANASAVPLEVGGTPISPNYGWFQCGLGDNPGTPHSSAGCKGEAAPHPNIAGHVLVAAALEALLRRVWSPGAGGHGGGADRAPPPPLLRRQVASWSSKLSGGRWRAVELRDEQSSSPRSWEPNFELPADTCIGAAELRSYVKENDGFEYVDEGTTLHPKPGLVARSAGATLALCLPIHCDRDGCAEKHQLAALGYLKSYDERMGNAQITCEEGCSCGGAESKASDRLLEGHHGPRTSVTWITWVAPRMEHGSRNASCPCVIRLRTQARAGRPEAVKFKVSSMMTAHSGSMDWIDPWKAQYINTQRRCD